jgi:hypothetical protein
MVNVPNNIPARVLSFVRQNESDKVFAVFNFSAEPQMVTFNESLCQGSYVEYFANQSVRIDAGFHLNIPAWGYRIFIATR